MHRQAGELRIIGGEWRSRRLRFPCEPGLRPTPDRLRETLFNWLGDWIQGRRVLDLFAGSGALGLEALSRGAAQAVFVECSSHVVAVLRSNLARLDARAARIEEADALAFLGRARERFDIVFLDPPWASDLAGEALDGLAGGALLSGEHRVYLERPVTAGAGLPAGWERLKSARTGGVQADLLCRESARHAES
ncbi:MAG: 16S rRNA (guanine(966)-N(2))-methyltransferase RsmD [Gammaproteobacteria bacterium]|nr:16S rRNA (guanine(966)-N(2))-methyltransferase RsmD [Gammaproteobacteria bacterium]